MATLQNIRSKGPLLIIVIGLALFAFIASDAWRVIQPHQTQDVGEVNGESLSAQEYQAMIEEYSEIIKFSNGLNSLTDEQTNQIKDEVWRAFVNNKLIEKEAEKIGLTVSKAEIQSIISTGSDPMLMQAPFRNPNTGVFDQDELKKFLVDYSRMNTSQMPAQYVQYMESMHTVWTFIEKNLAQNRLAEKYNTLLMQAISTNDYEAQVSFNDRVNQADMLLAAIPYSSIPDSAVTVKESEVKNLYNKRKEEFKQPVETRDVKYIDVQVTPSAEDRAAIQNEVVDYTNQLTETNSDYTTFIRQTGSDYPYVDLYYSRTALPDDVAVRLDSVRVGEVYGPYYNVADNTINSFKYISRTMAPDSIEFRQIQVFDQDIAKTRNLADSIYNALRRGARFTDIAERYGQAADTRWVSSANFENTQFSGDDLKYVTAITNSGVNEISNIALVQGNIILQVTNRKIMKEKYKVAVIKRSVDFSRDTYNRAYNDFSQFIAANPSLAQLEENAEDAGYKLLERNELYSSEHMIGGIRGTKDALRWAFSAKPGDVSGLYEVGESDRLLVVAVSGLNPEGYRPYEKVKDQLIREVYTEKKGDKILADIKAKEPVIFADYRAMDNAVSDSVKHVSFAAPAYVSVLRSSEPLVSAYASVGEINQVSAPIRGRSGVMVLQIYAKEKLNEAFDPERERQNLQNMNDRSVGRFINDLYLKGNVKDNRYLFF